MKEIITEYAKGMKITEEDFLKAELDMGIGFHNPYFVKLAEAVAEIVRPLGSSILDYGAGTGVYADAYHRAGLQTYVYEIFEPHRNYIKENAPHLQIIDQPIQTDVLSWIEVAEHMMDEEINELFKLIKPKYILFSSTSEKTDWDLEWGHIHILEQNEWDILIGEYGYIVDKQLQIPTPWAKIYKKI